MDTKDHCTTPFIQGIWASVNFCIHGSPRTNPQQIPQTVFYHNFFCCCFLNRRGVAGSAGCGEVSSMKQGWLMWLMVGDVWWVHWNSLYNFICLKISIIKSSKASYCGRILAVPYYLLQIFSSACHLLAKMISQPSLQLHASFAVINILYQWCICYS